MLNEKLRDNIMIEIIYLAVTAAVCSHFVLDCVFKDEYMQRFFNMKYPILLTPLVALLWPVGFALALLRK